MSRNIEMNYKTDSTYEPLYPQTTCDMVIDLLNTDTKSLMGLPTTATGDDAFRELFLAITLDGRALINFTVMGNDGTPCKGVQIESSAFCDSNGNLTPTVVTDDEGKVSVFCNNTSVAVSVKNYFDLEDWSHTYTVVFGEQYEETITLTRRNFLKLTSSVSKKFSSAIVRIDVTTVGGGGGGDSGNGYEGNERYSYSGGGGGGGYCTLQENVDFSANQNYQVTVGGGGKKDGLAAGAPTKGGTSSFLGVTAQGGNPGSNLYDQASDGKGNGNGGASVGTPTSSGYPYASGRPGSAGTVSGYSSFTATVVYGGGGGSGTSGARVDTISPGTGGGYGGRGGYAPNYLDVIPATSGTDGFGGGGGGAGYWRSGSTKGSTGAGDGGSGCVAIRMYTQSTLPV